MAQPVITITGTMYTPGGQTVVAGHIKATLYPPGQTGIDTDTSTVYKYAWLSKANITDGQFDSFKLTQTQSLSHGLAYYAVHVVSEAPLEGWQELWRLPPGSYTSLNVNSMTLLTNTPIL
jgi:hypothetical protein